VRRRSKRWGIGGRISGICCEGGSREGGEWGEEEVDW
jgi:hypothetical protein